MKDINPNKPIILGLSGKAVTGKTSVAESIVPKAAIETESSGISWDHIFFALPLYELANIRKQILGTRKRTRQLYAIHDVIYDIFGGSAIGNVPDYEDMINIVQQIYNMPIEPEGIKPRTFLQKAGDICRSHNELCFSEWAINKSKKLYNDYTQEKQELDLINPFCVIISDVRFLNEAEAIKNQENGVLITYTASEEVRQNRMIQRDGMLMSEDQMNHISEKQIDDIIPLSDLVMDTSDMSVETQKGLTVEFVSSIVGTYA